MKQRNTARMIAMMGLLIALQIVLVRFISIETPYIRISFEFIAVSMMGMLFSPVVAGAGNAAADFLGITLFSKSSAPLFPGFTLSAFLRGFIYGLFFYKKEINIQKIILVEVILAILIDICLNTFWLYLLMGPGVLGMLPARIVKALIMLPIKIIILSIVTRQTVFQKYMKRWVN